MKIGESLLWLGYSTPFVWPRELSLESPALGGTSPSSAAGRGAPPPSAPHPAGALPARPLPRVTKMGAALRPCSSLGEIKGITAGSWMGFPARSRAQAPGGWSAVSGGG